MSGLFLFSFACSLCGKRARNITFSVNMENVAVELEITLGTVRFVGRVEKYSALWIFKFFKYWSDQLYIIFEFQSKSEKIKVWVEILAWNRAYWNRGSSSNHGDDARSRRSVVFWVLFKGGKQNCVTTGLIATEKIFHRSFSAANAVSLFFFFLVIGQEDTSVLSQEISNLKQVVRINASKRCSVVHVGIGSPTLHGVGRKWNRSQGTPCSAASKMYACSLLPCLKVNIFSPSHTLN